jgi:hypothetical protein
MSSVENTEYVFLPNDVREKFANAPFESLVSDPNILEKSLINHIENKIFRENFDEKEFSVMVQRLCFNIGIELN